MFRAMTMPRRLALLALGALVALSVHGANMLPARAADAQFTFRMATAANPGQPLYDTAKGWKDEIEAKSGGRIHIDLFGNSQLGDEPTTTQGVITGTVDMGAITLPPWTAVDPKLGVLTLPYIFKSISHAEAQMRSPAAAGLLKGLEAKGVKAFAFGDDGWLVVSSRKPIKSVEDFKGLRIRVLPGPIDTATMKAFGAVPQQVAYAEIYLALKQGVIDATEASLTGMYTSKVYEVAKYLAVTNHLFLADILVMNAAKFNSLPPDLQKIVATAAVNAARDSFKAEAALTEDYAKRLAGQGMEVQRFNDRDLAAFGAAARPVYDQFSGPIGQSLIDSMRK